MTTQTTIDFTNRFENNNDVENEIWLDAIGYEGEYKISSLGRIKSLERIIIRPRAGKKKVYLRILKPNVGTTGYPYVGLRRKSVSIHRVVAKTFLPNPENKKCVNHINGIKTDNRVENLEWVTFSENNYHSFKFLNRKSTPPKGKDHILSKKIIAIDSNGLQTKYEALQVASRELKHSVGNICMVLKGQRKHSKGVKFIYDND